ncbi:glucans biosynthesis glucosyltransferase MdoH [Ovoidimarina sediminis]|uniref:glucans biosynthesis glucosyltransferase MdoH n=1 Tax=Ovoidimarina sediminis TaxID=3079856 RepID=UPI002913AC20|nr:glucans biosynthesis glucosyltransferase MdoH [Rhodophyticola sp. MJ-SS7]MDU8943767.1 glucans biosynthesis glucosyltransferase MdoH [Rhodophyticola sp. MJ-SS7]
MTQGSAESAKASLPLALYMPPEKPLQHPRQDLKRPFRDNAAPGLTRRRRAAIWRVVTFLPALLATLVLVVIVGNFFAMGGLSLPEALLIGLMAVTFFWISLAVSNVTVGLVSLIGAAPPKAKAAVAPIEVALLVPAYQEIPWDVFGNAAAMLDELSALPHVHRFSLFILSDTHDLALAEQELRAFAALRAKLPHGTRVHYRRRPMNTDRKIGNLADWVERWGGSYEAMLVLDADSLMSGEAIIALADELSGDPSAGLIQSCPQLFGAETVFGRVQQFASTIYGAVLAEGIATWSDREGNYWGHNAIIRTAAFAASARLPRLHTFRAKDALILSHDFVEAGLLRRAGWGVRFLPRIRGSYEEVPATLIDYVRRDRRWCQGNLQHLSILTTRGFHSVSRFHMFHGAMSYMLSPAWFALLTVWALIGAGQERNVITYFSGLNPQVVWPEMSSFNNMLMLAFMYGMLLAPKFVGTIALHRSGVRLSEVGGPVRFAASFLAELLLSILYAPILMVQQTIAVIRTALGIREGWVPQPRQGGRYGPGTLIKFHALETIVGALLVGGMVHGLVTLWLLPVAVSLLGAVPLSALSGLRLTRFRWTQRVLGTPEVFDAPPIIRGARAHRAALRDTLAGPDRIAAE